MREDKRKVAKSLETRGGGEEDDCGMCGGGYGEWEMDIDALGRGFADVKCHGCGVVWHFYGCGVRVLVICDLLLIHESSYTTSTIKPYNTTPSGCEHPTHQQRARTHLYAVGQDADYATSACVGKYTAIPPARRATHSIE